MTVDIHSALVSNALQHGIDDDKTASATNASTNRGRGMDGMSVDRILVLMLNSKEQFSIWGNGITGFFWMITR